MSPVKTVKNQYRGINAHLHSYWQSDGGWNDFHNPHIADIVRWLRVRLLPMGYTAHIEDSLQIRHYGDDTESEFRADILIWDEQRERPQGAVVVEPAAVTIADVLDLTEDLEKPYTAVAIYRSNPPRDAKPIAWIELLSPSNKRLGEDRRDYIRKRRLLVRDGIIFIEIDYLDRFPPTFTSLLNYTDVKQQIEAHPYRVVLLDPHIDGLDGPAKIEAFDVDDPIPALTIQLSDNDSITVDFNHIYHKAFEDFVYGPMHVDYTTLPLNFDRYSPADQARIARRILAVLSASDDQRQHPPLPVDDALSLDDALAAIRSLMQTGSQ